MAGHARYTALLDACVLYPVAVADALSRWRVISSARAPTGRWGTCHRAAESARFSTTLDCGRANGVVLNDCRLPMAANQPTLRDRGAQRGHALRNHEATFDVVRRPDRQASQLGQIPLALLSRSLTRPLVSQHGFNKPIDNDFVTGAKCLRYSNG